MIVLDLVKSYLGIIQNEMGFDEPLVAIIGSIISMLAKEGVCKAGYEFTSSSTFDDIFNDNVTALGRQVSKSVLCYKSQLLFESKNNNTLDVLMKEMLWILRNEPDVFTTTNP